MRRLRNALAVTAVLAVGILAGTAAHAVLTSRTGTFSERQFFLSETNAFATASGTYVNVPGAARSIAVPAGRMLDVRFTAESTCGGTGGWCTVRAIIVYSSGAQLELSPASGLDFAFDSPGPDGWDSNAIERTSPFLPAGTYRVLIQTRVVAGATSVRLDDWHLAIEVVRP